MGFNVFALSLLLFDDSNNIFVEYYLSGILMEYLVIKYVELNEYLLG